MKRAAPTQLGEAKKTHKPEKQDFGEDSQVKDADDRPMCKYGVKCYRKNPVHLQEFMHPGELG